MKKNIEQHLKSAFQELTPDNMEEIWNRPVEKACGNEWYLDNVPVKKKHKRMNITILSAVAACFVLCTAMYLYRNLYVESTVYLDVNPSIELQTNIKQKVVKAKAHNKDGEKILADMELDNIDVDVALNAILGSMVKQGYLSEAKHMILLSVEGKNQEKADMLCKKLRKEVDNCLQSLIGKGKVYAQNIQSDSQIEKEAKQYGISPGKVVFIHQILEKNPQLDFATLAKMPMSELEKYVSHEEGDIEKEEKNEPEESEDIKENKPEKEPEKEQENIENIENEKTEIEEEKSEEEKEKEEDEMEEVEKSSEENEGKE